jgi:hypothetical protein
VTVVDFGLLLERTLDVTEVDFRLSLD